MSVAFFKYLSHQHYTLENLRNIATVAGSFLIPLAVGYSSRVREKKRSTLSIIRSFTTDSVVTGRLQRLFIYRRVLEHVNVPNPPESPYKTSIEMIADSIFVLNLCDTVAQEIDAGLVYPKMLYHSLGPTLIGVRDVILARLENDLKMDLGTAYNEFRDLVINVEQFQAKRRDNFVTRIPATNSVSSITNKNSTSTLNTKSVFSTFAGLISGK